MTLSTADRPATRTPASAYERRLQRLLRRELDVAFARRARILLGWLGTPGGQRVLDCGCGRGFYLELLRAAGHRPAAGVDLELALLPQARRRAGKPALVANATLASLPFADGAFDAVLVSEVLEHVADDSAALREAVRVLRPGGVVLLSVPHADFPFAWDPLNKMLARFGTRIARGPLAGIWANHLRLYSPEMLRRLAESAGLAVEAERSFVRRCLPFVHFLLYGIGKPLLEAPGIGRWLERRTGRGNVDAVGAGDRPDGMDRGPWAWLHKLATWGDAANRDDEPAGVPTVNLALLARKRQ